MYRYYSVRSSFPMFGGMSNAENIGVGHNPRLKSDRTLYVVILVVTLGKCPSEGRGMGEGEGYPSGYVGKVPILKFSYANASPYFPDGSVWGLKRRKNL